MVAGCPPCYCPLPSRCPPVRLIALFPSHCPPATLPLAGHPRGPSTHRDGRRLACLHSPVQARGRDEEAVRRARSLRSGSFSLSLSPSPSLSLSLRMHSPLALRAPHPTLTLTLTPPLNPNSNPSPNPHTNAGEPLSAKEEAFLQQNKSASLADFEAVEESADVVSNLPVSIS